MGGVKGCYQSDEARSEATWSSTMSQTVALFERPLPFAAGDKSQFTTYLVANRYRPGAERSRGSAEVLGSVGIEKQAQKQTSKQISLVLFVSGLNDIKKNRHTTQCQDIKL